MRIEYNVDVIGHDHVPDQANAESLLQYGEPIADDLFKTIVMKESQPAITG